MSTHAERILDDLSGWELSGGRPGWAPPARLLEDLARLAGAPADGRAITDPPGPGELSCGAAVCRWERDVIQAAEQTGTPICRKARWPKAAPFALFLSHDVDQIHDRELFRWLGDINHLRRHGLGRERGDGGACLRRILRPLMHPADPYDQFAAIRRIEGKHGWKSTFFLLEDKYWARMGGRFRWTDPAFARISRFLLEDACELGIHGSAYSHAEPDWWQQTARRFSELYGRPALGARNHYLKLQTPQTWMGQSRAGLRYDSTLGFPNQLGAPRGFCFPFQALAASGSERPRLIELPLSIMDQTLFRYLNLDGEGAFQQARDCLSRIIGIGGLAVLLWHNNFFHEEEYGEWEQTYERLLDWLAPHHPWVARGCDIAAWWEARASASLVSVETASGGKEWRLTVAEAVENFAVEIFGLRDGEEIEGDAGRLEAGKNARPAVWLFPKLGAGETTCFRTRRTSDRH